MSRTIFLCLLLNSWQLGNAAATASESGTTSTPQPKLHAATLDTILMGSSFIFTAVHESDTLAWEAVHAGIQEVSRIEKLISSWDPASQTSEVNRQAGKQPVKCDPELIALIERAQKISQLSNGYFDISFASADRFWKFDGSTVERPDEAEVKAAVARVGYEKIQIDPGKETVFLSEAGMRIGFGGIGKGYAANKAGAVMKSMGIESGVVNAGGDLIAWGEAPGEKPWTVGIINPVKNDEVVAQLDVKDKAVVTSGNYLKYVMIDGERYGHIINPRTGWPSKGLVSVTIICPDAELADALATTVFVLGKAEGLKLIDHLSQVEGILIDDEGAVIYSKGVMTQ